MNAKTKEEADDWHCGQESHSRPHLIVYDGRDFDPEVGLLFEPTRPFDPIAGRWLSDEPAGFEASMADRERYVGNRPAADAAVT